MFKTIGRFINWHSRETVDDYVDLATYNQEMICRESKPKRSAYNEPKESPKPTPQGLAKLQAFINDQQQ